MILLKNATIIDKSSPHDGKKRDILIEQGKIKKIVTNITDFKGKVVEQDNLHVSIGWLDMGAFSGEPGLEHREDFHSLSRAAAAGGYTGVACLPNTNPTLQNKTSILFAQQQSDLVNIFPIGAISQDCEGKDLAELYDMSHTGCTAFSDGIHPIQSTGLMKRSLEYVKGFNGLIINRPHDLSMAKDGQINEGKVSVSLGMKGIPHLAEELMLKRDLDLLAYTNSRLHVHNISTESSVQLIRTAKKKGWQVTASVPVVNLIYDDQSVKLFDTNFKVLPPLREQSDIKALRKGIKDGTIDCITSNHMPLEEEAKKLEFLYAEFGMIGLQTTFALLHTELSQLFPLALLIEKLAYQPRKILNINIPTIQEKEVANMTIFSPTKEWIFKEKDILSKSKNTPFLGKKFMGKVIGIINKEKYSLKNIDTNN